ncbi:MFS transporter [uncultured Cetobacterium sp.]|uniref:MFS transporter n=1 Tax=uncultured Cetobacterium sp. TaxID=527638 RepID=UPI002608683B|nr:MFS transporter [uncultured Cetobacterium sp.]
MFKLNRIKYNQSVVSIISINLIATLVMQGVYNVFTGIHVKNLGFGELVVGEVLSMNSISIAVGSLLNAYLSSKLGFKKTIKLGISLMIIGILGVAFFKEEGYLKIFSVIMGLGYGFPFSSVGVLLIENTNTKDRVDVFSKNFVVQSLGMVSGSYFGGIFVKVFGKVFAYNLGIPLVYVVCAIILFIAFIPAIKLEDVKIEESKKNKNFFKGLKEVVKGKPLEFIAFNTVLGFGAGLVIPFFSVYLKFALHIDNEKVGIIMGLSQLGLVIGGLSVPFIARRLGKENTVIICQLLSIPFLISIAFPQGLVVVGISFLLRSTLMNLNQPLIQNIALETVEQENRALMSSLISMSSNATRAVGMVVAGYIMEKVSYTAPYYITVVLYLIATYMFYISFKKNRE